jgi:hypothetical protein
MGSRPTIINETILVVSLVFFSSLFFSTVSQEVVEVWEVNFEQRFLDFPSDPS